MATVIIPAGCDGPLFNDKMPMWMRRLPTGRGLVLNQIVGEDLDLTNVGEVLLIVLARHVQLFPSENELSSLLEAAVRSNPTSQFTRSRIVSLEHEESSGPDTVAAAIRQANISGPIFIKDNDGSFKHTVGTSGNYVVGLPLSCGKSNGSGIMEATTSIETLLTKSFIQRTGTMLTSIVEKKLVSDMIAVGGFFFESASEFIKAVEAINQTERRIQDTNMTSSVPRKFISNVIQRLLVYNVAFSVVTTEAFDDWKTEQTWSAYERSFSTVIRSLERDIISAPNPLPPRRKFYDSTHIVESAVQSIRQTKTIYGGRCTIIITTSAPNEEEVREFLQQNEIPFSHLLCGVAGSV